MFGDLWNCGGKIIVMRIINKSMLDCVGGGVVYVQYLRGIVICL